MPRCATFAFAIISKALLGVSLTILLVCILIILRKNSMFPQVIPSMSCLEKSNYISYTKENPSSSPGASPRGAFPGPQEDPLLSAHTWEMGEKGDNGLVLPLLLPLLAGSSLRLLRRAEVHKMKLLDWTGH